MKTENLHKFEIEMIADLWTEFAYDQIHDYLSTTRENNANTNQFKHATNENVSNFLYWAQVDKAYGAFAIGLFPHDVEKAKEIIKYCLQHQFTETNGTY